MKHLFAASGGNMTSDYSYKANISFENSPDGWLIDNHHYTDIADWVEDIRQKLLLSGISDYQTRILDNKTETAANQTAIQFLFKSPIDCFHFRAIVEGNVPAQYPIHVTAPSLTLAENRYKRIREFAFENDVPLVMSPIFNSSFIVNPAKLYDLVAVLRFIDSGRSDLPFLPHILPTNPAGNTLEKDVLTHPSPK